MRNKYYGLTPSMADVLVALAGAGHEALTASQISDVCGRQIGGKVYSGLKTRGFIREGSPRWINGESRRTWAVQWDQISDHMWGRIMVDHARRHNYDVRSAMTEEDMQRCEVAA